MLTPQQRPTHFTRHNGEKAPLPFSASEYERRLRDLRAVMAALDLPAVLFTSMHNIAYYSGFLYCSFGRPFGCVVSKDTCTTISANIDGGQLWRRSIADNVIYTDWQRDNFWRAVRDVIGKADRIGIEGDHLTLQARSTLEEVAGIKQTVDIAAMAMRKRMLKSSEEIALIREGARIADIGGAAIRDAIRPGTREIDVAMVWPRCHGNGHRQSFPGR